MVTLGLNRALRRISLACLVMFVLLLVNINYVQGFEAASLANEPGNARAFYARSSSTSAAASSPPTDVSIADSTPSKKRHATSTSGTTPTAPCTRRSPATTRCTARPASSTTENKLLTGTDSALTVTTSST